MKRKSRKPKSTTNSTDEAEIAEAANGNTSEREDTEAEETEIKKRKGGKRKSVTKKAEAESPEPQYEVEQILDEKNIRGVRHYLIRWKGYEPESDTWEPESTLNCAELITEFKAKQKKKGKASPSKKREKKGSKDQGPEETWNENEDFEVERILDVYFKRNGQREFLVSWKGYSALDNSWEPEENMDCKDLIEKFMSKVERAKEIEYKNLRVNPAHTDRLTLMSDGGSGRRLSKRHSGKQRIHYHDAE